jgi:hypothetical protein
MVEDPSGSQGVFKGVVSLMMMMMMMMMIIIIIW